MSYHSDNHNTPRDVGFLPVGPGLHIPRHCMGCDKSRSQVGGKGGPGPRWRCAACVAEKQARAV